VAEEASEVGNQGKGEEKSEDLNATAVLSSDDDDDNSGSD